MRSAIHNLENQEKQTRLIQPSRFLKVATPSGHTRGMIEDTTIHGESPGATSRNKTCTFNELPEFPMIVQR